ncbi:MAG: HEAT repeat domain-containing protein [Candidatus Gastranaerophilaceae bacterium]
MIQAPNLYNPYMQQIPMMQPAATPAPNYNAVKIDVHNPAVSAPGVGQVAMNVPQYAQPTMPYYSYPQAQLYDYPQAQQVPYYMPVMTPQYIPQAPQAPQAPVAEIPAQPLPVAPQQIQQQNINVPEPVVTQQPAEAAKAETPKVEIEQPAPLAPQVDLNAFLAKLTSPDYEVQANAMEEIANMVKDEPQKATELLDEKVMNALTNIVNNDSSKLQGPTQEQITARQKLMAGEKLSDADTKLATTITPMEQSERNKSYAMFTSSILEKLYGDEVAKLTNTTVPLTELPGAVTIVEQLKNNPNPMVRTSAIEALSYIQQPAYKQDLATLFTIAKNDQDKNVQEAANAALAKLEQMQQAEPAKTAA